MAASKGGKAGGGSRSEEEAEALIPNACTSLPPSLNMEIWSSFSLSSSSSSASFGATKMKEQETSQCNPIWQARPPDEDTLPSPPLSSPSSLLLRPPLIYSVPHRR